MLDFVAKLTWRRPKLVLALVGVFVVGAGAYGYNVEHHLKAAGFTDSASQSERATSLLLHELGYTASPAVAVLVRPHGGGKLDLADPAVRREVDRISHALADARYLGHVVNPLHNRREGRALIEPDRHSLVITASLSTQDVESDGGLAAEDAKKRIGASPLDVRLGGFAVSFNEVNDETRADLTTAEMIAFPILTVLLLLVFRGVIAAAIPLLLGVISILGTFLMLRVMASLVDTSLFALNIATALSLGLAVDYGLLMVSRYREELDRAGGVATEEAHRRTVQTAGRTVLFSGFTVAVALAALILMPQRFLYSVGAAGAAVGLLSALMAILVVPSMLALLGTRINALSTRRGPSVSDTSSGWYRLARGVMRRPVAVAVGCTALLLLAASPLLSTTLTGPSAEAVPPSQPSYAVNQYIDQQYSRGVSFPITVTIAGDVSAAQLARVQRRIDAIDGIEGGTPFVRASRRAAFANFTPASSALAGRTQDAVHTIRSLHVSGGGELLVSGNTARFIDEKESLMDHLPLVGGIIAGTTLLLLFALTGSVLLPIKTLIMNALTLGASLGIIVLAFQKGVLDDLFAYTGPAAIEVTSLAFLFAVTFALATDYAVLVMARIKEQHDLGAGNEEAVAVGIGRTGRVITAAAGAIAVVFLAFGVSKVFFMKQISVGEAAAVIIDTTIVRALLVPALMRLLGDWNWWAPGPLRRLQARFGFAEG
ncbi:MAG: trehalose monomycolate/heme transporter [Solirubrobacteraceae bacterium]|jgi:RND superfamily putative drug exporter|nr:trehalose monomycolate/heme transporter [Solirubrobacteraceae bacterium]